MDSGVAAVGRLLVVIWLVAAAGTGCSVAAPSDAGSVETTGAVAGHGGLPDAPAEEFDPDRVQLTIAVGENGTARWTAEYFLRLDSDNESAAWASLEQDIESDPENFTATFERRITSAVAAARNRTGRAMSAGDFSVRAENRTLGADFGVVVYTFRWTGFGAVEGDRLRVGDAIDGFVLQSDTTLSIRWPSGYEATEVTPEPDARRERTIVWKGAETDFVAGDPRVVIAPAGSGGDLGLLVGGSLAVLALVATVLFVRRRGLPFEAPSVGTTATDGESAPDGEESTDEELLSNEERVLQVVRDHDGRVKQQRIVEELDWTEAKTSQVVRSLREEGDLEGFRLGRENVLRLPEIEEDDGK